MATANDGQIREKVTEEMRLAEKGMALFAAQEAASVVAIETDLDGAQKYKAAADAKVAELEKQIDDLPGKENMKARNAISREAAAFKNDLKYIDAQKVIKGVNPPNGNFIKSKSDSGAKKAKADAAPVEAAPAETAKDVKSKKKAAGGAGISSEERNELEKLKTDIIARKTTLKAEGLSGGQQNKDPEVVKMVMRMNELKEKEEPGSTQKKGKEDGKKKKGALSSSEQKEFDALQSEIDQYKGRLKAEFGYSNKDIKVDPDLIEMEKKLANFEKRDK